MRYFIFLLLAGLTGCGVWTSTIRSDVLDYNGVVTDTIDKYLLVNVLEARDNVPIHFVEMPKITGTLQAGASLQGAALFPQSVHGGTGIASSTVTPNISVQSTPTFEVDNLDTKDFATGTTSPIDTKQIQYWYDRGLDHRILLLMFFSSLEITQHGCKPPPDPGKGAAPQQKANSNTQAKDGAERKAYDDCIKSYWVDRPVSKAIASANCKDRKDLDACMMDQAKKQPEYDRVIELRNDPRAAIDNGPVGCAALRDPLHHDCSGMRSFSDYLSIADKIHSQFVIRSYSEEKLLAENVKMTPKDLARFDPAKYSLDLKNSGDPPVFDVYSKSVDTSTVFCLGSVALTGKSKNGGSKDKCSQSTVKTSAGLSSSTPEIIRIAPKDQNPCARYPSTLPQDDDSYCQIFDDFMQYLDQVLNEHGPHSESSTYSLGFTSRAPGELVRYLGDILYYQEKAPTSDTAHNNPFTLDFSQECHKEADEQKCLLDDGGYLFVVNSPASLCPVAEKTRFSVNFRDKIYTVADPSPCDHTLSVLAIVSLAINLNKSATDIRTTPVLQVVP